MLVHTFLEQSASRLPDKTALVCSDQRWTYRQLNEHSDRLASSLTRMGVKRQDRVVVYLENSAEAVISIFGILKAGAAFVLLNTGMKANKLNFIIKDSGARAIIAHRAKAEVIDDAISDATELEHVIWCHGSSEPQIVLDSIRHGHTLSYSWSAVTEPVDNILEYKRVRSIDLDLATIIYTSGSTGEPKGVVSAHYNVVAAATSITTYLQNREDDIILSTLPLSFDYGLYQVLMAFLFGGTVILEKSFGFPYKVIERLVQERVTAFPIVPTMVAILLQMEDLSRFDFSALRYITNTAAALPVSYIEKLQALFPHVTIFSMYGLTECKRVAYLPPEELSRRPSSVGIPIPNEETFILNADGKEVGPGEIGELVVRGLNVMQGYWNRPEETAKTFRPGRYRGEALLYTGDLFKKDEDGFLYFVARKDDMIKTRGERVSPKEVENALCAMDGVVEAAVIGVPDDILGQAIKSFVVRERQSEITQDEVMKYCMKSLEPFMVPKYVEFHDSLPKSPSGKIDKKSLAAAVQLNLQEPTQLVFAVAG